MCSVSVQWLKPTHQPVEALRIFPFLDGDGIINGLKAEIPVYLAATEDVWLSTQKSEMYKVAQPQGSAPGSAPPLDICSEESAAGAIILGCSRKGILYSQEHALADYLQAGVMTQYNKR